MDATEISRRVGERRRDLFDPGKGPISCEHGTVHSGSVKAGNCLTS
jgi:hypothetical protein